MAGIRAPTALAGNPLESGAGALTSGLPRIADVNRPTPSVGIVPIVLQNSELSRGGAWLKRWRGGVGGFRVAFDYSAAHCQRWRALQSSFASRLKFCAVAVSNTSSLTPFKPRSRSRSSLRMRFIWANRISTFLRSRCDCWKASVLASARTRSRTSSSRSRVILRAIAVVHFGFNEQREQSLLVAL